MIRYFRVSLGIIILAGCTAAPTPDQPTVALPVATSPGITATPDTSPTSLPISVAAPPAPFAGPVPPGALIRIDQGIPGKAAFSPDGQSIALATSLGLAMLDPDSLAIQRYVMTGAPVIDVDYSPQGDLIAAVLHDGTLVTIEAASGQQLTRWEGGADAMIVRFSKSGEFVATVSKNGGLAIRNAQTGEITFQNEGLPDTLPSNYWPRALVFSPDDQRLAVVKSDITIWNLEAGTSSSLKTFPYSTGDNTRAVAFIPEEGEIVTVRDDNTVVVWDAATGEALRVFDDQPASVGGAAFLNGGLSVVVLLNDGRLVHRSSRWGIYEKELPTELGGTATAFVVSPDQTRIFAVWSFNTLVSLLDATTGKLLTTNEDFISVGYGGLPPIPSHAVAFSPDGSKIATETWNGVLVWDLKTTSPPIPMGPGGPVAFSPSGDMLAAGDWQVELWDVASQTLIRTLEDPNMPVIKRSATAISPDGKTVASAFLSTNIEHGVTVWDAQTGDVLMSVIGDYRNITDLAFSPDGHYLYASTIDGKITVLDVYTSETGSMLDNSEMSVNALAYSPDGDWMAAGLDGGQVLLWELKLSTGPRKLAAHGEDIVGVAFSPDGLRMATISTRGEAKIWDVASGELLSTLSVATSTGLLSVAFSPDLTLLATASTDGTVVLWPLSIPAR